MTLYTIKLPKTLLISTLQNHIVITFLSYAIPTTITTTDSRLMILIVPSGFLSTVHIIALLQKHGTSSRPVISTVIERQGIPWELTNNCAQGIDADGPVISKIHAASPRSLLYLSEPGTAQEILLP